MAGLNLCLLHRATAAAHGDMRGFWSAANELLKVNVDYVVLITHTVAEQLLLKFHMRIVQSSYVYCNCVGSDYFPAAFHTMRLCTVLQICMVLGSPVTASAVQLPPLTLRFTVVAML